MELDWTVGQFLKFLDLHYPQAFEDYPHLHLLRFLDPDLRLENVLEGQHRCVKEEKTSSLSFTSKLSKRYLLPTSDT